MSPSQSPVTSVALDALREAVDPASVGEHLRSSDLGDGLVDEHFGCLDPGYVGWYWAVLMSAPVSSDPAGFEAGDAPTVNDIVLLPGDGAIVAPQWQPYKDRIRPDDLGPGDMLPPDADDIRLAPAWFEGDGDGTGIIDRHFAREIGLGREWVLSLEGREGAAERWWSGDDGPGNEMTSLAPATCSSCGFLVGLAGDLADRFGVCANQMSNSDGRVVAIAHGCGAHSGGRPKRSMSAQVVQEPVFDTATLDIEEF